MRAIVRDVLGSVVLGLSVVAAMSPAALYWWIHGDHERYIWIINGPAPYSGMGSGPWQLWVGVGLLLASLGLLAVGCWLKWPTWRVLLAADRER